MEVNQKFKADLEVGLLPVIISLSAFSAKWIFGGSQFMIYLVGLCDRLFGFMIYHGLACDLSVFRISAEARVVVVRFDLGRQ